MEWQEGRLQFLLWYLRLISVQWTLIKLRRAAGVEKPKSSEMMIREVGWSYTNDIHDMYRLRSLHYK